ALFRHPLGVPIPHTAIITERKDQFGETLGEFVQENFLSADAISERVRASNAVDRAATWLADPVNARSVSAHAADLAVGLADLVRDEDVHTVLETEIRNAVDRIELAPLAGRALKFATVQGRHQQLLDAVLIGGQLYLDENRQMLHDRFAQQAPWWLPGAVEDRIFDRILDGFRDLLRSINDDPNHEFRAQFDARVADLAERLERDPEMRARGEQIKQELLSHEQLREWTASLWSDAKRTLREQAGDPDSAVRVRLAEGIAAAGARLRDDPNLAHKADELIDAGIRYVVDHFQTELAQLVSGTIARWDGEETSHRLELLLGPDLQFIRINGTVVGALVGLAIHTFAQML
ncbi:MAG TPA: DUF445 domain-containing protein, partial [Acidimicrobiia bacterium]|nr:DUF445 domain-containing protein [Acidimicrobiia bacterium]